MMHIYLFFKKAPATAKLAWVVAILLSLNAPKSWGQAVSFNGTTYTQDFQGMTGTNTAAASSLTGGGTMVGINGLSGGGPAGWYTYLINATGNRWFSSDLGTSNAGGFRQLIDNNSPTRGRAFGSQGSGSASGFFGIVLRNTSGSTINSVAISFDAFINRNPSTTVNNYNCSYRLTNTNVVTTSSTADGTFNNSAGTWTTNTALSFSTPSSGTGGPNTTQAAISPMHLIGNRCATLTGLNWLNNQYLYIRWSELDESGSDATAGVDNFSIRLPATVTFNGNGSTGGSMANQTNGCPTNLTNNAFTRTGYTFAGWNTAANGSGTTYANGASYPFTSSTTLFAQWTANTLTITYDSQGGSAISNGTTTTGGSIAASPGAPTRAGYSFNGWFTASSGGSAISFPYTHNQTANFTLFAQWTANTLTITYNSQGGSAISNGSTTTGGQIAASPGTPTRAGYTFSGWFTASSGGIAISFPYTHNQTANFTLFAQWTANTLTITYNSQGGSAISNGSTTTGGSIATSPGTPTRAGYTFNGWFTASSGGTAISFPYTHNQTASFTLFAQWTANTLTITYDSQGGSAISNGSTTTGGSIAASPGTPTRAGYTFNGWFTASSGGTAISFPYTHNQTTNFTLFAQWTANTLTVTFDSQGGSAISNGSTTTGGTVANPGNPTQAGFTFDGWFVAASGGTAITFPYTHNQTANFTLFAQWTVAGSPTLNGATLSSALSNIYGTASTGVSFTASGTFLSGNITVTAQTGYEVSTSSGSGYGASVSVASGTTVWVRFAALQNAGTYNNAAAAVLSSAGATPVNVLTSGSGNTVSPKPLSVSAPSIASKAYDGTTTAGAVTVGTLSGFVGTQTVIATGAAANYSSANANNYSGVVITYTLSNGTNGGLAANYSLANGSASGVITPKALTITAPSIASKVYDATTTAGAVTVGTLSGLVGSETLTVTGAAANYSSANAGTYTGVVITYTLINGTGLAANYSLANGNATGIITPKSLSITAPTIASKVYDATSTAGAVTVGTLSGLVGSETLTVTGAAANYSSANAGTYSGVVITYTLINGTGLAANYSLANGSATGVITPKVLTITAPSIASKAYDATTTAGAVTVGTLSGLVGSETLTVTGAAANYSSANVGSYTGVVITYTLINGTGLAANYSLAAGTATGVITQRALTITANNVTKDAGTVITGGSGSTAFTSTGLQGGQTIGSVTIAYGAAAGSTGQGATPGTYTGQVTPSAATGGTFNAANYSITYASGSIIVVNYSLSPSAGSVAFTAFQASAPDGVEFITLRRLDLRNVSVTDNGILSTNAMRTGEGTYQFPNTSPYADIPAGTIIRLDEAAGSNDDDFTEGVIQLYGNGSTVLGVGNFALSTSGDQVIMYTGSAATPSFIAGIAGADAVANWNTGATTTNDSKAPVTASDIYFSSSDNGYYNSSVTGNANTIRTSAVTPSNWTVSASAQPDRFINKNILFNESNFSAGSMSISGVTTTSMTVDVSGVSFIDESASATRYAVVIRDAAAPTAPVDRYTCYTGTLSDLTANFGTDPTVKSATTNLCAGTDGNGKVVYLGYSKPSALVINGLTGGTTYHIGVYAVNGNGRSANFSSTGLVQTQATTTPVPVVVLSSPNQVIADDVQPGTANHIISHFEAATTVVNATLNQLQFTTSGTYAASELTGNFTLWYGTTNTFASATAISTVAAGAPGTYSFTGFSQTLNVNTTRYFWITCNVDAAANFPRTIQVGADPVLSFVSASQSGTISAGGVQTITPVIPTVSTSAISNISESAADGGGDVTNDGSAAVTARGVVWGTAANPAIPSVNSTTDGSGIGVFTSSIASLNPQTQYFVRAYATNVIGTGYGSNQSFYTLSNPPSAQAVDLIATPVSTNQIDLGWDAASFPATGATVKGYILLRATNPAIPTFISANGTIPAAGTGVIVSSSIIDPTNVFSNTGLAGNTTYNYLLIPYTWDGVNPETYHYLTTGAATATATTPPSLCTSPTLQASSPSISSITASSALLSWTVGNGNRSIVIVKQGSASTSLPIDGVSYTASNTFGSGTIMGPQEYVCYNNNGSTFTLIGLASSTTYHYAVYTYNSAGNCYLTPGVSGSFTTLSSPSVIETFEPGIKPTYPNGNATCALGIWNLDDVQIGTSLFDRKVAAKSARMINSGTLTMLFDKPNGLGTVNIQHAKYGPDANTSWRMEVSDDGGASFNAYISPTVFTTTTDINTTATFVVNIPGNNIRIRIVKLSGGTNQLNIDQISLGNFVSPNTITTSAISGSPFCVTGTSGITVNVPFTSVGAYDVNNVYTAQLSDANGSFSIPTDIGTLTSDLNSGTIPCEIPAGTPNGTQYRIRVVSSTPAITGSQNAANLSVFLNPPDVIGFYASISSPTALNLGWTNQTGCFDQILIVGRAASAVTALPTGDGTLYTANNVFGTGGSGANLPANEFAVYKAVAGTTVNVSGLTTGTTYFFKIFTRKGTTWSDGVVVSATPINIAVGDFRSNGSGNYSSPGVWQIWNGGAWVAASNYPNSSGTSGSAGTVNVTIRNGHTITLDVSRSSQAIRNLTVEFGAKIFSNDSTYNGNRYLTIYGDISCLGTVGNGFNIYDNISFNIEGVQTTISGTGSFNASRLRKNFNTNTTTNLIIAINTGLKFASGVGSSSGTNIYSNTNNTVFNMTINENTTVTLQTSIGSSGNISIDGIDGSGSGERGGKFTVNGNLTIPGTLFALTDNLVSPVIYEIGTSGIINCVNICTANTAEPAIATGSAAAGCTFRILNGGKLNLTGGVASDPNTYNKPFSVRTNTASPYTFSTGLGTTNNTFNFQTGSTVQYSSNSGSMPIQSQTLIYSNLLITGAATKTINSVLNVNKDISIQSPAVFNSSGFNINIGGDWNNYGTIGFTEGTASVNFNGFDGQKINCSTFEDFYNVNIQNSSTNGVELNCDVTISNDLNLGTNGRLFFGFTPRTLTLSKMSAASNAWIGSSTALFDMGNAAHTFIIGSEVPNYTGSFIAGTTSTVIYNRTSAVTLTDGNQSVQTNLTYANLTLSGTDNKNTNDDFAVTASLHIEGNTTQLFANSLSKTLSLGGDFTLISGAQMNENCFNNLTLTTTDNLTQNFNGNGKPFRFFNFNSTKVDGLLSLIGPSGNSTLRVKNDFIINYTATSLFEDNNDSLLVGDDFLIGGIGSNQNNYNLTGLLLLSGLNVNGDIQIANANATGVCKAHLGSLSIQTGQNFGLNKRVEIYPLSGGGELIVKGSLDIVSGTNGAELNTNNNNLSVGGNWTNYNAAAFIEGTATVSLNGASMQSLITAGGELFHNLTITNSSSIGLFLNSPVFVRNQMNFANGRIDLNGNNITMGTTVANGSIIGGNANSYAITWDGVANGSIVQNVASPGSLYFPVGDISSFTPITCNLNFATLSSATLTGNVKAIVHPNITSSNNYIQRYWSLEPSGISNFNYQVSYSYAAGDAVGIEANLFPFKYNASGWLGAPGSGAQHIMGSASTTTPATRTLTWTDLYTFSDFTGIGNGTPLPISLLNFNATLENDVVKVDWATLTETNNDYFTVERTKDGKSFEPIYRLSGSGNSNELKEYVVFDSNPFTGLSYYRLKQTDFDGKFTFSGLRPINFNKLISDDEIILFNHLNQFLEVKLNFIEEQDAYIQITSIDGKVLQSLSFSQVKIQNIQIPLEQFANGIYVISVVSNTIYNQKFSISK